MKTTAKSDETRARILATALELFRSRGFEGATMREIAAAAGVATGAAYYYFDSKDAIVLAFYDQAQHELRPLLERALQGPKDLRGRLLAVLDVKLQYFAPNRRLLGALTGFTDAGHPLSPFSPRTLEIRQTDIAFFQQALEGSRVRIPAALKPYLPRLLWLYQMGLILFWIQDRSPEQRKTRLLLDRSLRLIVRLIQVSSLPLMQPLRRLVVETIEAAQD